MKSARVLLSGYYGFDNAGDEAVLAGLVLALNQIKTGPLSINVLSNDPNGTRNDHGVSAAHRYKPLQLLKSIGRCDLLMSGGGSLLQDVTSAHSVFYYLAVVRIAQMLHKKTMFAAQGIGPLNLVRSRKLVASVAQRLDRITVRDQDSKLLLQQIGVTKQEIFVTADPAILLGSIDSGIAAGTVAVALRPWQDFAIGNITAASLKQSTFKGNLIPIAMQPDTDKPVMEQFLSEMHQTKQSDHKELIEAGHHRLPAIIKSLAQCEMVVGMRLHALILAAASGVPSVAIGYDPKVASFMSATGQGDAWCDLNQLNQSEFAEVISHCWENRTDRRNALIARLPALQESALRTAEIALDLV